MTIDLEAIQARHERDDELWEPIGPYKVSSVWGQAHADRAALLAEVERLRAVVDAAKSVNECEWEAGTGRYKWLHEALASLQEESTDV